MRPLFLFFIFFIFSFSSYTTSFSFLKKAYKETHDGITIVYLEGDSFQIGYEHGYLLKKEIKDIYKNYLLNTLLKKYASSPLKRFFLWNYFKLKALSYQKYIPKYLKEELKGIAKGCGLSYSTILVMHTFLDTMSILRKFKQCTNFIFMPPFTLENKLYHGRDLGFSPPDDLKNKLVIFFIKPKKGIPFVSISWPGLCGVLSGMNMEGISISETSVGTAEVNKKGVPLMFLLRDVIQNSQNLNEAIKRIISQRRICGYTITLAQKNDEAATIEVTSTRYKLFFPKKNYLISVNHYLSPELFKTMKPVYPHTKLKDSTSYKRLKKFEEFIKRKEKISYKELLALLRKKPFYSSRLLQSILFIPQDKEFFIFSEKKKSWIKFSLKDFFKGYRRKKEISLSSLKSKEIIAPHLVKEIETQYYKRQIYTYLPPYKNRLPDKSIWIYLYLPKNTKLPPLLFFLPHSQGVSRYIEENLARFLTENGFAFLTLETGFQRYYHQYREFKQNLSGIDLALLYSDLIKELLRESQNILFWIEKKRIIDKERVCIGGLSLGSIVASLLMELTDIKYGLFILGGADLKYMFSNSKVFKNITKQLKEKEKEKLWEEIKIFDPLNYAYRLKNRKILMINALFDRYIPRKCTEKLWLACGCPKIYWLLSGHLTSFFSLGFVENKILLFLKENLKKEKLPSIKKLQIKTSTEEKAHLHYEGKKIKVIAGGKYSSYEKKLKLGVEIKEIFNTPLSLGIAFKGRWEKDPRYDLKGKLMQDIYLKFWATRLTTVKLGLSFYKYAIYDLINSAPLSLKLYYGRPKTNFLNIEVVRSTLDDKIYPTKGTYFKSNFDIAASFLDSDSNFFRTTFDWRHYYNLGKKKVFVVRTKWGYLTEFAESSDVPFFEKFFLGGSSTIRGYKGRRIGPLDSDLYPLGGKFFGVLNLEFRFPLYKKWYSALFWDTGFLVDKPYQFSISKLKYGSGIGLRYKTKWGFIRVDFAGKIGPDKDTSRTRIHVSFGLPF